MKNVLTTATFSLLLFGLLHSGQANALLTIGLTAQSPESGDSMSDTSAGPIFSGVAKAYTGPASTGFFDANLYQSALPTSPCADITCAFVGGSFSEVLGEIDTSQVSFRGYTRAQGGRTYASLGMQLTDSLTFHPGQSKGVDISIDLNYPFPATPFVGAVPHIDGGNSFSMEICVGSGLTDLEPCRVGNDFQSGVVGYFKFSGDGIRISDGVVIQDITPQDFNGTDKFVHRLGLDNAPFGEPLDIITKISMSSFCPVTNVACDEALNFLNTAHVGVFGDYESANGYNYTFSAAPVPVPAASGLLVIGLAFVRLVSQRQRSSFEAS